MTARCVDRGIARSLDTTKKSLRTLTTTEKTDKEPTPTIDAVAIAASADRSCRGEGSATG